MRYLLAPTNTLLVRGPAKIHLLEGHASILAAPLQPNQSTFIAHQKQLPVEADSDAVLEINLERAGEMCEIEGSTIPSSWKAAAEALLEMEEGRVMVIGDTDVGKSTLCVYLTNRLIDHRVNVHVVDADIGQADLGPPTTIGSATPSHFIASLGDLPPASMLFIGHTSPTRVEPKLIEGIQKLSTHPEKAVTIVNTDGWVLDREAILFKTSLIAALKPDLVLGLGKGNELQPILSSSRAQSMRVEAAKQVLARSRTNRREIRAAGYLRFLNGGKVGSISLKDVQFSIPDGFPNLRGPRAEELRNLIVGFVEENGYLTQIGIFRGVEGEVARVYSRETSEVRTVEFGYVRLSTSGREIGYLEP
jgi:polynucleotide 5'-hydroxyl-kinase GRC3/NOL9